MTDTETLSALVVPGISDQNTLACLARARTYSQYVRMVEKAIDGECPFCRPDTDILQAMNMGWNAWQNPFPEKHTRHHFVIAPIRHIKSLSELTPGERLDLFEIMLELKKKHKYTSSGVLVRDGDATLSAGTVEHLHVHVMVPDGTGRVESPFYKGVEEERMGVRRAIIFEKLRHGLEPIELTEEERRLVSGRIE